ncbi:hypothetical protein NQ317_017670 [Molorchus minor]|uniref:Uncharacterized protein n=1 Tax=Molorchus minor TaxID=1323400 RepID=A0ABQ9JXJ2_9CUCU|nr:hypothetical protein NQ317_017670 [Molorchus minor]
MDLRSGKQTREDSQSEEKKKRQEEDKKRQEEDRKHRKEDLQKLEEGIKKLEENRKEDLQKFEENRKEDLQKFEENRRKDMNKVIEVLNTRLNIDEMIRNNKKTDKDIKDIVVKTIVIEEKGEKQKKDIRNIEISQNKKQVEIKKQIKGDSIVEGISLFLDSLDLCKEIALKHL